MHLLFKGVYPELSQTTFYPKHPQSPELPAPGTQGPRLGVPLPGRLSQTSVSSGTPKKDQESHRGCGITLTMVLSS